MSLGKRIQLYRKQNGLSQEQLASQLNVSRQALSKWESDINVPNIDKIIDVAKALDVSINELLGLEKDSNDEYAKLESILNQVVLTQNNEIKRNKRYLNISLVVGIGVFLILSIVLWSVFKDVKGIRNTIKYNTNDLNNQINSINNQLSSLENNIFDQLQKQLQAQDSLLSSFAFDVENIDFETQTMKAKIDLVVKNYEDSSSVVVILDYEHHDNQTYPLTLNDGHFKAIENLPIDNVLNATVIIGGDNKQSQLLTAIAPELLENIRLSFLGTYELKYLKDKVTIILDFQSDVIGDEEKFKKDNRLTKADVQYRIGEGKTKKVKALQKKGKISFTIPKKELKHNEQLYLNIVYEDRVQISTSLDLTFNIINTSNYFSLNLEEY